MAFSSVGVRRALTRSSSIINRSLSSIISSSSSSSLHHPSTENPRLLSPWFRSISTSLASFSSRGGFQNNNNTYDDDKISPDTILFEGCDYNHWLITMDFRGQDPQPTPQEMVDTYVHTAAKVLGSVEEAKKKIYACSTTTYHGFQVEVSEEVSKKFEGLPGVVFILPDSYIDPVNKQYGGDQYINGTIIPRPPPVQYGRQGGRYGDRNRDRQREPYRQGDGRNFGPQQGYTQQQNHPQQHNYSQQQNYPPQDPQQNYPPQGSQHIYPPQGPQQNYPPQRPQQNYPQQQNFQQQNSPPQGSQPQLNYTQPQTYPPQRYYSPQQNYGPTTTVERMDSRVDRNFAPSPRGGYGQGAEPSYGEPKWDGAPGSGAQWKDEK